MIIFEIAKHIVKLLLCYKMKINTHTHTRTHTHTHTHTEISMHRKQFDHLCLRTIHTISSRISSISLSPY